MEVASNKSGRHGGTIKVLLVDDSMVALTLLRRMLSTSPDIEVIGMAQSGEEALRMIPALDPAVVLTDLHMPGMGGLEFTRQVIEKYPRPILVVSVSVEKNSHNAFELLQAGAIDVFTKPRASLESEYMHMSGELVSKVKILAGVHVIRKMGIAGKGYGAPGDNINSKGVIRAVAIGASTGGPQALYSILSQLPHGFPMPVICVQHITEGFMEGLVEWLQSNSQIKISVAGNGDYPFPGHAYFAQEGAHLLIDKAGLFRYAQTPPYLGHRPSINLAFKSVAERYASAAMGILLTGMGDDGAEGMKAIESAGGMTIAQDEATSVVHSMPRSAIDRGAARYVLPLDQIADVIISMVPRVERER
ncbi:MAG: chemotaxis-specific protein-glutamate methyltransferase CheB [Nitrospinae bacterium]|nr:chemotaxis-specific protein-glutamate methyltransferase CheB [Nitrospinota bacterium]